MGHDWLVYAVAESGKRTRCARTRIVRSDNGSSRILPKSTIPTEAAHRASRRATWQPCTSSLPAIAKGVSIHPAPGSQSGDRRGTRQPGVPRCVALRQQVRGAFARFHIAAVDRPIQGHQLAAERMHSLDRADALAVLDDGLRRKFSRLAEKQSIARVHHHIEFATRKLFCLLRD